MRVAVAGALGRMGRTTCAALASADGIGVVGGIARVRIGEPLAAVLGMVTGAGQIYGSVESLCDDASPDVLVDFTTYPDTVAVSTTAVDRGVAVVVGTTGWNDADRATLAARCNARGVPACIVPNFALGAVLMMRFAAQAARVFPSVEIIELHHDLKKDAPSGTAGLTAARIAEAGGPAGVPIHSVRLRGLVAHQEVLFGGNAEVLTVRHDTFSREAFMDGVLLAVRGIRSRSGLTIGLEPFLAS